MSSDVSPTVEVARPMPSGILALICLLLLTIVLAGCRQSAAATVSPVPQAASASPTSRASAVPSEVATRTAFQLATQEAAATLSVGPLNPSGPSATASIDSSGSLPSPTVTPTLLLGRAPRLPHQPVHFVTNGDRSQPLVALTFDMCQTPANPSAFDQGIFVALVDAEAPATFFLGGDWMRTHVTETRLLAEEPLFELGNHSWSHPDMRELDEARMTREVLRTQDLMYQITGRQTLLWRFPAGLYNDLALSVVAFQGLYSIQWDVVTADPVPDNTAENILRLVQERVQNGSIIVMHGNGRGWHTAEALPGMIEYLRDAGYCLATVSQLIGLEPVPEACGG
jgi:peptidoglycan/xylan/chitin deacetylase (PgdA/CDA1 family)